MVGDSWEFELVEYRSSGKRRDEKSGVTGDIGVFGPVAVERSALYNPLNKGMETAWLSGQAFPKTVFRGKRRSGQPSLHKAELTLAGKPAELRFNSRALRKEARRLHIAYERRTYVYSVERPGKPRVLEREGAKVEIEISRHMPPTGYVSPGTATGSVDAVDLAIAIVLEEVDTDVLTLVGTAMSSPFALMHYLSDTGDQEK
ncbi:MULTISPECIES: hypothetical protein [Streptomyces]|uniref:hypothetical protein n=1 Tax=Streptomyces TaxID=1883 RepID=UPI000C25EE3A|nr:hypothetical protein [Streptomyces sp. TSRI0384-2]PJM82826.1 hypothetical protein CH313_16280 [Streptomyces sp. TSRI0384-2]